MILYIVLGILAPIMLNLMLLSQKQKINAIKYYRNFMHEELKVDMGLRQAKDTIDAIGRGESVDLSVGYQ